ncbi:hypothetical protein J8273_7230 [Carpediemonas membranifera]|uniref:Uncharacterized protein n=1 Tax=Carpediemonas membranifera TaxID=201153 RepID=A0A8J6B6E4_9EUKA|nr:hypothetical protein J8273_7230 [Carpediemonas membranifera]|eukprot:KAG9390957.1 hypothetical protein J8273_7230 [Carpediemonas membranifera]
MNPSSSDAPSVTPSYYSPPYDDTQSSSEPRSEPQLLRRTLRRHLPRLPRLRTPRLVPRNPHPTLVLVQGPSLEASTEPNPPKLIFAGRAVLLSAPLFLVVGTLWEALVFYLYIPLGSTGTTLYEVWYGNALGYYSVFSLFQLNYFSWGMGHDRPFSQWGLALLGLGRHGISWFLGFSATAVVELALDVAGVPAEFKAGFHFSLMYSIYAFSSLSPTYFDGRLDGWISFPPLRLLLWVPGIILGVVVLWWLVPLGFRLSMEGYDMDRFNAAQALCQWWLAVGLFVGLHLNDLITDAKALGDVDPGMSVLSLGIFKLSMALGLGTVFCCLTYLALLRAFPAATPSEAWIYTLAVGSFFLYPNIQISTYSYNYAAVDSPMFRLAMRLTSVIVGAALFFSLQSALMSTGIFNPDFDPIYLRMPVTTQLNFTIGNIGLTHFGFSGGYGFFYQPAAPEHLTHLVRTHHRVDVEPGSPWRRPADLQSPQSV